MRGEATRSGAATCSSGPAADLSGCGTWDYDMAGNGAQLYLKLLNGNDLNFEVHLDTKPYAFGCFPLSPAFYPAQLSVDSTVTLAQLESRPPTVLHGTLTQSIDYPDVGYHGALTGTWEIRFRRTA